MHGKTEWAPFFIRNAISLELCQVRSPWEAKVSEKQKDLVSSRLKHAALWGLYFPLLFKFTAGFV